VSIPPWGVDRPPLVPETAATLIRASFGSVDVDGIAHLGSGWDFDAFVTRDGWVFRFPRRAECAATLDAERRIHDLVARALPSSVAIPRFDLLGEPSAAFPYRFAGYRFISGVPADAVSPALLTTTALTIGLALGAIHGIPDDEARASGLREWPTDDPDHQRWLERTIAAANALRGLDPTVDRSLDWLATHGSRTPRPFPGPLRCIHNDLSPEHLLVDPRTGTLAGILDWSDAIVGDPALDFAPLGAFHGWAFVDEVVRSYPLPIDGSFLARLRFLARLLSVIWLIEAYERAGEVATDVAKHIRWVHNVFGETGHLEETDDAGT